MGSLRAHRPWLKQKPITSPSSPALLPPLLQASVRSTKSSRDPPAVQWQLVGPALPKVCPEPSNCAPVVTRLLAVARYGVEAPRVECRHVPGKNLGTPAQDCCLPGTAPAFSQEAPPRLPKLSSQNSGEDTFSPEQIRSDQSYIRKTLRQELCQSGVPELCRSREIPSGEEQRKDWQGQPLRLGHLSPSSQGPRGC